MAAMPVDATTTARFAVVDVSCRRKVVFPVPARPVRNTLHDVFSISLRASSISGFGEDGSIVMAIEVMKILK